MILAVALIGCLLGLVANAGASSAAQQDGA
jgi:hypothetical protein